MASSAANVVQSSGHDAPSETALVFSGDGGDHCLDVAERKREPLRFGTSADSSL